MKINIRSQDLWPPLKVSVRTDAGPVDLSSVDSVHVKMVHAASGVTVVDAPMVLADQEQFPGQVSYEWQPGDTGESGDYLVTVVVMWAPGKQQSFPSSGPDVLTIV